MYLEEDSIMGTKLLKSKKKRRVRKNRKMKDGGKAYLISEKMDGGGRKHQLLLCNFLMSCLDE